jgi:hypothetical protein
MEQKYYDLHNRYLKMNAEFELNLRRNEDNMKNKINQLKEENEINRKT